MIGAAGAFRFLPAARPLPFGRSGTRNLAAVHFSESACWKRG